MDQDKIQAFRDSEAQRKKEEAQLKQQTNNTSKVVGAVQSTTKATVVGSSKVSKAVDQNATKVSTSVGQGAQAVINTLKENSGNVTEALNNLVLATLVSKDPALLELTNNVANLLRELSGAGESFKDSKLQLLPLANEKLASAIDSLTKNLVAKPEKDYTEDFQKIQELLEGIEVSPIINLPKQEVKLNLDSISDALSEVKKAVVANKVVIPKTDNKDLLDAIKSVQTTIANLKFPVPNYILPFKDSQGKAAQVQLDASGNLPITTGELVAGDDFNYLDVQQTDSDTETYVFKTGGSGGTTVRTIVVNYTSSAKTDIDNVSWS